MTNYKRFITYLYFYESGKKMGNVGFARVETSDELGKVTIHCSTKVVTSKECKVYLLKRTKSMTISKQVAVATSQNGNLDIKLSFDRGTIDGSEFHLKDTQGVVLLYSKDNCIAAKWDNSSVSYHEVISLEQEEMQQPISKVSNTRKDLYSEEVSKDRKHVEAAQIDKIKENVKENVKSVQPRIVLVNAEDIVDLGKIGEHKQDRKPENSIAESSKAESGIVEASEINNRLIEDPLVDICAIENKVEENHDRNANSENLYVMDMIPKENKEENKSIKEVIPENIQVEKANEKEEPLDDNQLNQEALHAANYAVPNPNLWADHPSARAILNRFVRMYPFDDGEIAECVRLEPKDIGLLPMNTWVLGNNSFLLHSYCNFRHILFAKKLTREGCVYLLMVPGSHNNREQQLAKMFGFDNFKCSRRRSMRDGEFGYWYVTIVFD